MTEEAERKSTGVLLDAFSTVHFLSCEGSLSGVISYLFSGKLVSALNEQDVAWQ